VLSIKNIFRAFSILKVDDECYLSIYLTFFNLPRPAATAAATATA